MIRRPNDPLEQGQSAGEDYDVADGMINGAGRQMMLVSAGKGPSRKHGARHAAGGLTPPRQARCLIVAPRHCR